MRYYTSLRRKLCVGRALTGREWLLLAEAWLILLEMDLLLRAWPFLRLRRWVEGRFRARPLPAGQDWALIRRIQPQVARAGRNHLYPMTCLRQSLALQDMLGRRGVPAELRIGVHRDPGRLLAHAWLEYQGQPVSPEDDNNEGFTPLGSPEAGR